VTPNDSAASEKSTLYSTDSMVASAYNLYAPLTQTANVFENLQAYGGALDVTGQLFAPNERQEVLFLLCTCH
jgi:hypothetical protein